MSKYTVGHTVDDSGARIVVDDGIIDLETDDLRAALKLEDELTSVGKAGYIQRDDGAMLAPDGSWFWTATKLTRDTFQLPASMIEDLRTRAQVDNVSKSEIVRRALGAYL